MALKSRNLSPYDQAISGFMAELADQKIDLRIIEDVTGKPSEVRSKVLADRPDVILCLGTEALEIASSIEEAAKVFCMVPLCKAESVLSRSEARNVHGVVMDLQSSKQFRVLMEVFPGLGRIGVMYDPALSQETITRAALDAKSLNLELIARPVHSIKDVPAALDYLKDKIDILWSIFDNTAYGPETSKYALLHTLKKDIPFIGFSPQFAKAGALVALYGDYKDMGRQTALMTRKVMNKELLTDKSAWPQQIRIAINKKVAEALRIDFSPQFLQAVSEFY